MTEFYAFSKTHKISEKTFEKFDKKIEEYKKFRSIDRVEFKFVLVEDLEKWDVYSFGRSLCEILYPHLLYGLRLEDFQETVKKCNLTNKNNGLNLKQILDDMICPDPEERKLPDLSEEQKKILQTIARGDREDIKPLIPTPTNYKTGEQLDPGTTVIGEQSESGTNIIGVSENGTIILGEQSDETEEESISASASEPQSVSPSDATAVKKLLAKQKIAKNLIAWKRNKARAVTQAPNTQQSAERASIPPLSIERYKHLMSVGNNYYMKGKNQKTRTNFSDRLETLF